MSRFARIPECAIRCRDMSASDWRVYTCIALHADASGRAWPSMEAIAEITGVRAQDVSRTIRRLMRLIGLQCERGGGRGRRNVYVIPLGDREPENIRNGAGVKTGGNIRNDAEVSEPKHPQPCEKTSAPVRRTYKQTKEQTNTYTSAGHIESADWFERFLRAYPDRGDQTSPKKAAQEKFSAALKRGVDPAAIVRGAENYRRAMARYQGEDRRFVKQPANWLKEGLWQQYQAQPTPAQPKFGGMI